MKYTLKTEAVTFEGGEIVVRGLTVPDLSQLVEVHQDSAVAIYEKFSGKNPEALSEQTVESVALEILGKFPSAIAHLLYLCDAEREPDTTVEPYASLPIDVQVAALEKIATLTFAMQGGVKNFVETVVRLVANAGGLSKELRKPQA
ncbi:MULTISPECIES: phage pre-tape measure protein [unclassified Agrobacterium]